MNEQAFGNFDYGLTKDEEARAAKLHEESIVIDLIGWGPSTYLSLTPEMDKELDQLYEATHDMDRTLIGGMYIAQSHAVKGKFPSYKEDWEASGITAASRTIDFSSWENYATSIGKNIAMFDVFPWVVKALKADDFRRAKTEGKRAVWINTQLSSGICKNFIDLLEPAYEIGLRMVQLSYNSMNLMGAGCTERTDAGVSNYGARAIAKMNELGIIVDTGHCGRQTTLDACELSRKPVIASHTSAQGVLMHARGKSDEEFEAIADSGGVIGIVTVPFFMAPTPPPGEKITIESMLDHIDYVANLVGWAHVVIGTDWPMALSKSFLIDRFLPWCYMAGFREEDRVDEMVDNLVGFDDYRDFPNITRGLVKRGYNDEQIKGILGENFLRVFEEVCG